MCRRKEEQDPVLSAMANRDSQNVEDWKNVTSGKKILFLHPKISNCRTSSVPGTRVQR